MKNKERKTEKPEMETEMRGRLLILGLGNLLMGDEGLGVHLAHRLEQRTDLPNGVHVIEGGTAVFFAHRVFYGVSGHHSH